MKKRKITRRCISLIELLIALGLTVIILMTLTFFYQQVSMIGIESDKIGAQNFHLRYVETRLAKILPKAVGQTGKQYDFVFFSTGDEGLTKPGSQSLIFTFDNTISLEKEFSGHDLGRLYLDKNGNLMFAYWPSPKRWKDNEIPPMKKELLLEGAEKLSFEFFIAPERKGKEQTDEEKKSSEPEPKGEWRRQDWLQDYNQLPVMVKMIVEMPKGQNPLVFIYPLANAKPHVVYE